MTTKPDLREAYMSMAVQNYRDVLVPSIADLEARAVAAGNTDEAIREAAGRAYDKMMGKGDETVNINVPSDPHPKGPMFATAALAMVPEHERHLYGGKAVIQVGGGSVDRHGKLIEQVHVGMGRGGSTTTSNS